MRRTSPIGPVRAHGGDVGRRGVGADGSNRARARSSPTSATSAAAEPVGPRRRQLVDRPLEGVEVDGRARLGAPDADGDAGQRAGADVRLERPPVGAVGGGDGVGDALGQLGGEPVAGQVDEHGDPRPDRLGHLEHPHELALLEADDRRARGGPRPSARAPARGRGAGSRARCASPARCGCACAPALEVEGVGDGVADAGDVEHADPVGVRRQQADEAVLHRRPPAGRRRRPSGARPGTPSRRRRCGRWSTGPVGRHRPRRAGARSSSRARPSSLPARSVSAAVGGDVVVGGAEEHELAVGEPRQDRLHVGERVHPVAHRREVVDDALHVGDARDDLGLDLGGRSSSMRSISICVHASTGAVDVGRVGGRRRRSRSRVVARPPAASGARAGARRGRGARGPSASCRRGTACRR